MKWYEFEVDVENDLIRTEFWEHFANNFGNLQHYDEKVTECAWEEGSSLEVGGIRTYKAAGQSFTEEIIGLQTEKYLAVSIKKTNGPLCHGSEFHYHLHDLASKRTLIRLQGKICIKNMHWITWFAMPNIIKKQRLRLESYRHLGNSQMKVV